MVAMIRSYASLAVAIVLASAGQISSAHADDSTALLKLCTKYLATSAPKEGEFSSEYIQLKSSCAGFINSHVKMSKPEDGFCIPKGYNMDDLARVYAAYMAKHPERADEPTRTTMSAALSEVYKCAQ